MDVGERVRNWISVKCQRRIFLLTNFSTSVLSIANVDPTCAKCSSKIHYKSSYPLINSDIFHFIINQTNKIIVYRNF